MAQNNFEACHKVTSKYEGGFVNHPADPGGATNWGITRAVLADWRKRPVSVEEVRTMPYSEALSIFKRKYWDPVGAEGMPKGVDLACYDWGVNSGVARGRKAYSDFANISSPVDRVKAIMAARRSFFSAIIARNNKLSAFKKGWANRVAGVEAYALKMAYEARNLTPAQVQEKLTEEAATARKTADKKQKQANAAGGGAAITGAGTAVAAWDLQTVAFCGMIVLVIGFVAFMAMRAAQGERARVEALLKGANDG